MGSLDSRIGSPLIAGPLSAYGQKDIDNAMLVGANKIQLTNQIKVGVVEQFNVGLYSALVTDGERRYVCFIGAQNTCYGFGYTDDTVLREGDEVIFALANPKSAQGMILARKPTNYYITDVHHPRAYSDTELERRTHFFSNETYRKKQTPYITPLMTKTDVSTKQHTCGRPTDLVPGEFGTLNQHHCGFFGGLYSFTISGGHAQIRLSAFENRMRIVADSIRQHTLCGNLRVEHNRRYLTEEKEDCLYQEERYGFKSKEQPMALDLPRPDGYHDTGYHTKNIKPKQTARPRIKHHSGWYGGLDTKYCLRPDPDEPIPRTLDNSPLDAGVARESIDPSGQYRLATTGMLGMERIGRIPVPVRKMFNWQKELPEPEAKKLEAFKHDEDHPYYRQLELADRVAYDLKNSYARYDENDSGFFTPEEKDLEGKLKDIYDPGFTESETVKLEKYDKRRSGIWQGEDGSIILRDAWGSEIVMIGGNIQLSCAGNVMVMPGRSSITIAGDDIVQKAQNSIDIHAADKDVRVDGHRNVQIMAGTDDTQGGITLEARGQSAPWDATSADGGEGVSTSGIFLKSEEGTIVTDTKNLVLRAKEQSTLAAGKNIDGKEGAVYISAKDVYAIGNNVIAGNDEAAVGTFSSFAFTVGSSAIISGTDSAALISGGKYPVPIMFVDVEDVASEILNGCERITDAARNEDIVARGFTAEKLEKMYFKFRSSDEYKTNIPFEVDGREDFTLYEPFWVQVSTKYETLRGTVSTTKFKDCENWVGSDRGAPWPGKEAASWAKYAKISDNGPENLDEDGRNKPRKEVVDKTSVSEVALVGGYEINRN